MLTRAMGFMRTVFRNQLRKDDLPRFLTYTVTFGCNARCIMCDSWKMSTEGDLSLAEFESIVKQLPQMDAVRLTGGEPFVRKDFAEIGDLVQRRLKPLALHITTNGFLTDRIVKYCEQRDKRTPLHMLISIDGVGDKHNTIRGSKHAYSSVIKTIEALAPRQKKLRMRLGVNQTIVDADGLEHYKKLRGVLKPFGVYNNVVMAYDSSATYNLEKDVDIAPTEIGQFTTFGEFNEDTVRELIDEVSADLKDLPWWERVAKRYYLEGIRNRLVGGDGTPNPKCVALNSHLRIFPNGDVPTCQFNSKTIGNLRQQSFRDVWKSARAAEQRKWVRACPGCWAECEVMPSAVYTLDLVKQSFRSNNGGNGKPSSSAVATQSQ